MQLSSRAAVLAAALVAAGTSGCAPQCEDISVGPQSVCRRADAGVIAANTPFVVFAQSTSRNACSVTVDGGLISLTFAGRVCSSGGSNGFADPIPPGPVACDVPALPAGTYSFNTSTPVTFSIPESSDAGISPCP